MARQHQLVDFVLIQSFLDSGEGLIRNAPVQPPESAVDAASGIPRVFTLGEVAVEHGLRERPRAGERDDDLLARAPVRDVAPQVCRRAVQRRDELGAFEIGVALEREVRLREPVEICEHCLR